MSVSCLVVHPSSPLCFLLVSGMCWEEEPCAWNFSQNRYVHKCIQPASVLCICHGCVSWVLFVCVFQGWSSAYSIESVIMQINATLVKGKARVQFGANKVTPFVLLFNDLSAAHCLLNNSGRCRQTTAAAGFHHDSSFLSA